MMLRRVLTILALVTGLAGCWAVQRFELLNPYYCMVLIYLGINVILTTSLNLINGYMGEFSVGHAGFMAVGAYVSSVVTVNLVPAAWLAWFFPVAVTAGGLAAAAAGLLVAIPSFRIRGDYLAIVTLAFCMIVKSAIENLPALGGPQGFMGMELLTNLPWVYGWVVLTLWIIRNLVHSKYGRGMAAIRNDEIVGELCGVRTRRVKIAAFVISAFFAGVAGALYAHLLQFVNPRMFDIVKSTEILIMVYLGGMASLTGSILGASVYTVLMEMLRGLGVWRMVLMPLLLVLLMLFRPRGMMGLKECPLLVPLRDRILTRRPTAKGGRNATAER